MLIEHSEFSSQFPPQLNVINFKQTLSDLNKKKSQ
jgi:hypothetical protein